MGCRWTAAARSIVVIVLLGALLPLGGCGAPDGDAAALSVTQRVEDRFAAGATTFDFAVETPFSWDRMYIFGPFTTQAAADRALGFHWTAFDISLESADSFSLLVFVEDDRVTHWCRKARGPVTLDSDRYGPFDRAHAKFVYVDNSGDGPGEKGAYLEPAR